MTLLSQASTQTFDKKERALVCRVVPATRMDEKQWSMDGLGPVEPPGGDTSIPEPECITKEEAFARKKAGRI